MKTTSIALTGAILVAAGAAGAQDYTARLSLDVPEDNPKYAAAEIFADAVSEKTDGAVEIQLFANSLLGGEVESAEGIRLGSIQAGIITSSVLAQWVPEVQVLDLPFIFNSDEHAIAMNEPLTEALQDDFAEAGFHLLGFTPNGARAVISKEEVRVPADVEGKKMRVIQNDLHVDLWETAGASPTPIPHPEIYNSMQTGVVDLFDNTASNYYSESWYEVAPYYTELNHIYAIGSWVFSESWWQNLPEEHRAAIEEAAAEAQSQQPELQAKQDEESLARTEEAGSTIITDVDREAWIEVMQPVRDEYAESIPGAEELLGIIADADPDA
ncbi:TRAP transporter substrate-binding protein [Mesobaculum littorinae]|uniref:TRAP transporter substrate-binding protein n=1 Tax=Mesobaculum littorinae TaxID=2486419 RepID=A0A438AJI8_9RHOB|nr:TRAP transporter substrate-binding protein [Mesobaculum littorinae]RVV98880.1 TRAP transporter substrate-binding protein [Mesobaculum littorinae]